MSFLSFKLFLCSIGLTVLPVCSIPWATITANQQNSLPPDQQGLPDGTMGGGSRSHQDLWASGDRPTL